jgi:hydrogenase maturation protease
MHLVRDALPAGERGPELNMGHTCVIGVGNRDRGDDAAGPEVARRLAAHALPDTHVMESDGRLGALFDAITCGRRIVVVDAMSSGAPPGSIRRFDAVVAPLPAVFGTLSTHGFGVAEAVELARTLGRLPESLEVIGIEGASWGFGAEMTAEVERAVAETARELRALTGAAATTAPSQRRA